VGNTLLYDVFLLAHPCFYVCLFLYDDCIMCYTRTDVDADTNGET